MRTLSGGVANLSATVFASVGRVSQLSALVVPTSQPLMGTQSHWEAGRPYPSQAEVGGVMRSGG